MIRQAAGRKDSKKLRRRSIVSAGGLPLDHASRHYTAFVFMSALLESELCNQTHEKQCPKQQGYSSDRGLEARRSDTRGHKKAARVFLVRKFAGGWANVATVTSPSL